MWSLEAEVPQPNFTTQGLKDVVYHLRFLKIREIRATSTLLHFKICHRPVRLSSSYCFVQNIAKISSSTIMHPSYPSNPILPPEHHCLHAHHTLHSPSLRPLNPFMFLRTIDAYSATSEIGDRGSDHHDIHRGVGC